MTYIYEIVNIGHRYLLDCPIHEPIRIRYTIVKLYTLKEKCRLTSTIYKWSINFLFLGCIVILFMIFSNSLRLPDLSFINSTNLQSFKTMFISIILEAFPFILLGVFLSSILQIFVSDRAISRMIPKNPILGILFACLIGIIFPVCECGMIPVVRRLILKGMPIYVAVVFVLTGPILNPIVYFATFTAFRTRPEIAYTRMGLAFVVAFIIGLFIYRFVKKNPLRHSASNHQHVHDLEQNHINTGEQEVASLHDHSHDHVHEHSHDHSHSHGNKFFAMLGHASDEFFEMGKYLMFGSMVTALIQTFMARESLVSIGHGPLSSHLFMMGFAYILSLCSTSDAFVASSFVNTFTTGSLLTFLVFGPMLDMKGTLMLLSVFKTRFVLLLMGMIIITVLVGSLLFERIFFQ
ncbi:MAG: permease [Bacilli bacterium]|nr:permease [Bacilli bacterium]